MEVKNSLGMELSSKELLIMSNLFFSKEYPHCSLTLEEVADMLGVSKATSAKLLDGLVKKGVCSKVRSFISFYYPVADLELRSLVLERLGILGGNK